MLVKSLLCTQPCGSIGGWDSAADPGLCLTSEIHCCELSSAISLRHLTWLALHLSYSGLIGNMSVPTFFTSVMGS